MNSSSPQLALLDISWLRRGEERRKEKKREEKRRKEKKREEKRRKEKKKEEQKITRLITKKTGVQGPKKPGNQENYTELTCYI